MAEPKIQDFLTVFQQRHLNALIRHFLAMASDYQKGEWENSIAKSGKFVEAVLKALWVHVGNAVPTGRTFKADTIINGLGALPFGSQDDTIRLLIPRACRFVYDVASNRGGRHDPGEVEPNELDAAAATANCSWILAEMIRYSQRGKLDSDATRRLVDSLIEKKYPLIERVDGRVYFHGERKSAPDVMLAALADRFPGRMSKDDLIKAAIRHRFSLQNARKAVTRILRFVDDDGTGQLRLLAPGLKKAEQIMKNMTLKKGS